MHLFFGRAAVEDYYSISATPSPKKKAHICTLQTALYRAPRQGFSRSGIIGG
jgi:hypothetical protein